MEQGRATNEGRGWQSVARDMARIEEFVAAMQRAAGCVRCDRLSLVTLMQRRFIADDYARMEVQRWHWWGTPSGARDIQQPFRLTTLDAVLYRAVMLIFIDLISKFVSFHVELAI